MEFIRGISLDTLLQRNGRLSPTRVGRLLVQLCEVLQAAHTESIIHRDLKPANLMVVDPDTPHEIVKVMDFGLAKLADAPAYKGAPVTGAEFAVGTPGYMCPEQARGEEMDHRGDLYSVGVILYELLSGRLPFSGGCTMDVLLGHATEEPPWFADIGISGWVPPPIEDVVRCCLAKRPEERPSCARELAERYETALAHQQVLEEKDLAGTHPRSQGSSSADQPPFTASESVPGSTIPHPGIDPNTVVHQLEAWMPETIATYKLRGFVHDLGGEVVESVPGRIRVRIGGRGSNYAMRTSLGWLGLGRKSGQIDMELHLQRTNAARESQLRITVLLRPVNGTANDSDWRIRAAQVYCDLRGYLMGHGS
jgi:serine/threonine-protein kinase